MKTHEQLNSHHETLSRCNATARNIIQNLELMFPYTLSDASENNTDEIDAEMALKSLQSMATEINVIMDYLYTR